MQWRILEGMEEGSIANKTKIITIFPSVLRCMVCWGMKALHWCVWWMTAVFGVCSLNIFSLIFTCDANILPSSLDYFQHI